MHQKTLQLRIFGFVVSLLLTITSFSIFVNPEFFHLEFRTAILIILILAVIQSMVQVLFFLDLWNEQGPRWNLGIFLSTVSMIFIIVFFSIWIMDHLNYNMMP